jgi:hypothetical protein
MRLCLSGTAAANGPIIRPQMIHELILSSGGMILPWENRRTRRKTCPNSLCPQIHGQPWKRTRAPAVPVPHTSTAAPEACSRQEQPLLLAPLRVCDECETGIVPPHFRYITPASTVAKWQVSPEQLIGWVIAFYRPLVSLRLNARKWFSPDNVVPWETSSG